MMNLPDPAFHDVLQTAVAEFASATRFPLAFGGLEYAGTTTVSALAGHRTGSLYGLRVRTTRGLGGRAMSEGRPRLTTNYARSSLITHDYDTEISAEDIVTLLAMPVIVDGHVRAVLYGGNRAGSTLQSACMNSGMQIAKELATEIRVQDEVTRRIAARATTRAAAVLGGPVYSGHRDIPGDVLEEIRSGHAELRSLAAEVFDPELRERLTELSKRLARIGAPAESRSAAAGGVAGGGAVGSAVGAAAGAPVGTPASGVAADAGTRAGPGAEPRAGAGSGSGAGGAARIGATGNAVVVTHLSPRELDVLTHAALGSTNAEVGRALRLAESTVKSYMKTVMSKLNASTRHAAVAEARRCGLIP